MSFYSAEARGPTLVDLAGVLCAHGALVCFGRTAARLSVTIEEDWRARALIREYAVRGAAAHVVRSDSDEILVRTAFRADLLPMADTWYPAGVKAVPGEFTLDGPALRLWALVAGRPLEGGYELALDPATPHTHEPLAGALATIGLPGRPFGGGSIRPVVRVRGRRRLENLQELVGPSPRGAEPAWPGCPLRAAG
ncbi:hypothetical protein SAMN05216266_104302 [Amycolatopsis marina]|uniref:Uncharacterized protein n=1 Tax=Amycolatopsis marina TaxID=490629 RepID=A0A1I0Y9G4_9PSEU|nr:hypothetical protein [Amycolatopsis marina]SFB09406.1 hypothetical protein SAMN05216266_104302 [Amycolatopsis marina]